MVIQGFLLQLYYGKLSVGQPSNTTQGPDVVQNRWYHVAVVATSPIGVGGFKIYIDGVLITDQGNFKPNRPAPSEGPGLYFGCFADKTAPPNSIAYAADAYCADFRFYDAALTQDDIVYYSNPSLIQLTFNSKLGLDRFKTGDPIKQDDDAAQGKAGQFSTLNAPYTLTVWDSTGTWGPANTGKYIIGPVPTGRIFYDEASQTTIKESELVEKFGRITADSKLNIYELTEQPVDEVKGYEKVGDKYKPITDFSTVLNNVRESANKYERYVRAAACPWSINKSYSEGDVVEFNGKYYQALTSAVSTADNDPEDVTNNWKRINVGSLPEAIEINGFYPLYYEESIANTCW